MDSRFFWLWWIILVLINRWWSVFISFSMICKWLFVKNSGYVFNFKCVIIVVRCWEEVIVFKYIFLLWIICGGSDGMRLNLDNLSFVRFILLRNVINVEGGNVIEFSVSFKILSWGNLRIIIWRCWGVMKFFVKVFGCWNSYWIFGGFEWRYLVRFNFFNMFVYCNVCKNLGFYFNSGIFK